MGAAMNNPIEARRSSLFGVIGRWWRNLAGNRRGLREVENLDPEDLQRLALDTGVDPSELKALAAKWPDAANLLSRRLAALHIDPAQVARTHPAVSNDLRRLCAMCVSKGRCEHDLDRDPSDPAWREYCPNRQTLDALGGKQATKTKTEGNR
jgi:hypothetical protein